jgi:hypothetical protein
MPYVSTEDYRVAFRNLFASDFFERKLGFSENLTVLDIPRFLSQIAKDRNLSPYQIYFRNTLIDIDYNNTILVKRNRFGMYYDYRPEDTFYFFVNIAINNQVIKTGLKYVKAYLV